MVSQLSLTDAPSVSGSDGPASAPGSPVHSQLPTAVEVRSAAGRQGRLEGSQGTSLDAFPGEFHLEGFGVVKDQIYPITPDAPSRCWLGEPGEAVICPRCGDRLDRV